MHSIKFKFYLFSATRHHNRRTGSNLHMNQNSSSVALHPGFVNMPISSQVPSLLAPGPPSGGSSVIADTTCLRTSGGGVGGTSIGAGHLGANPLLGTMSPLPQQRQPHHHSPRSLISPTQTVSGPQSPHHHRTNSTGAGDIDLSQSKLSLLIVFLVLYLLMIF